MSIVNVRPLVVGMIGFLSLAICGGCNSTVEISYRHLHNFYLFDADPNTPGSDGSAGANGLFGFYKIVGMNNTKSGAKDFTFNLSKVYSGSTATSSTTTTPSQWSNTIQNQISLPAGQQFFQSLGCFVVQYQANPVTEKDKFAALLYNSSSGESVLMVASPKPSQQSPTFIPAIVTPNNPPPCN